MDNLFYGVLIVGPATAICGWLTSILIESGRKWRAFQKLKNDPRVYVGAKLMAVKSLHTDVPLIETQCRILTMKYGRLELLVDNRHHHENGGIYTFTGREFENLVPVFGEHQNDANENVPPSPPKQKTTHAA